ncbi:MlaD family protein [Nocardia asteroides]|uniref:MlaD family protein n=1 Tax=Nocardia asteroides TaxID=1824 RepID=UPI001E6185C3|nr:MCE family protein [Nocardia asteroides]UGT63607.1 MCE family protein [Nocardia asteroides]
MLLDPSGRGPTAAKLSLAGLVLVLITLLVLGLLALRYEGYFEKKVPVTALLTSTGDGLPARADVKFRGMVVGTVDAVEVVARGQSQRAEIHLKPGIAGTIPADVTARVIPNNLFGVTAIELVDQGGSPDGLRSGAVIPEDTGEATVQLQTTLTVLRDVLENIQPEKLGRVLATLSAALDPGARAPGSTIERLDHWMTEVHAIPEVGSLLGDLGRATTELSKSAPELVGVLAESVTTARTLTERREGLVNLLATAGGAVDSVNELFARNPDSAKELVPGLAGLFGSLAGDAETIPLAVHNLNYALEQLEGVFSFGPSKQMVWKMDVSFTPFQQYTAADCPRYGELAGPRCGGPTVPEVAPEQEYPAQMLPQWLDAAGPPPVAAPAAPAAQPLIPGLPAIPGLPSIPGLFGFPGGQTPGTQGAVPGVVPAPGAGQPGTPGAGAPQDVAPDGQDFGPAAGRLDPDRPAAAVPGAPGTAKPVAATRPLRLRGAAAVAALTGGKPTAAQLLLLTPLLAGGSLEIHDGGAA